MHEYNYDYSKLRGLIREKLHTEREFARRIGRSITYISQVFNNAKQFSQSDILKAMDVLCITPEEVGVYFFTTQVHKSGTLGVTA